MSETELAARLERLERDNRRFKKLAVVALVVAAAIGTMAATQPVPQKVVAHEFVLTDGQGKTRATLAIGANSRVFLRMYASGSDEGGLVMGGFGAGNSGGLMVFDNEGSPRVNLTYGIISPSASLALFGGKGDAILSVGTNGSPDLELTDESGYKSVLGVTNLVVPATGQKRETSADSIVMFGNGKKPRVIWQAPR